MIAWMLYSLLVGALVALSARTGGGGSVGRLASSRYMGRCCDPHAGADRYTATGGGFARD